MGPFVWDAQLVHTGVYKDYVHGSRAWLAPYDLRGGHGRWDKVTCH